jgi:hypothetical protein
MRAAGPRHRCSTAWHYLNAVNLMHAIDAILDAEDVQLYLLCDRRRCANKFIRLRSEVGQAQVNALLVNVDLVAGAQGLATSMSPILSFCAKAAPTPAKTSAVPIVTIFMALLRGDWEFFESFSRFQ